MPKNEASKTSSIFGTSLPDSVLGPSHLILGAEVSPSVDLLETVLLTFARALIQVSTKHCGLIALSICLLTQFSVN